MSPRIQRLGFAFGGVLLITLLWVRLFPAGEQIAPTSAGPRAERPADVASNDTPDQRALESATIPLSSPSPAASDAGGPASAVPPSGAAEDLRTYAVGTYELAGLPPDARPGTRLEVWAAWEPPIVRSPRFQKILEEVTLEKIVPGLTPEAPTTALLLVPDKDLPALLYADRWGALTVAILP